MICTCKPQRLEEGSSGGKTAVWSRKGTKEGTPSRLKTANREENGRFIHKKVVFCGQSSDLNAGEAAGKGCGISLSRFDSEKAHRAD